MTEYGWRDPSQAALSDSYSTTEHTENTENDEAGAFTMFSY